MPTLQHYETLKVEDLKKMRKELLHLILKTEGYKAYLLNEELQKVKRVLVTRTGDQRWR
jgi:hypothetical protein